MTANAPEAIRCDSPQMLLPVGQEKPGLVACGLCFSCAKAKDEVERQRRYYWLKRKRGHGHV